MHPTVKSQTALLPRALLASRALLAAGAEAGVRRWGDGSGDGMMTVELLTGGMKVDR
jgi:hypothetical protein